MAEGQVETQPSVEDLAATVAAGILSEEAPKAPKADEQPKVDESKTEEKSITMVDGLRQLTKTIESALKDTNDKQTKITESSESDKDISHKTE